MLSGSHYCVISFMISVSKSHGQTQLKRCSFLSLYITNDVTIFQCKYLMHKEWTNTCSLKRYAFMFSTAPCSTNTELTSCRRICLHAHSEAATCYVINSLSQHYDFHSGDINGCQPWGSRLPISCARRIFILRRNQISKRWVVATVSITVWG